MNKTYHFTNAISPEDFQIIYEEEQRLNNDNTTVQALVIANIADEILRKYVDAYNIDYDLTDMSNMAIDDMASMSAHVREGHSDSLGNNGNELVLANIEDYQSAQALSEEAIKIFGVKLKQLSQIDNSNSNTISAIAKVEKGLIELDNLLNNKASAQDLMNIVHGQIHPDLQLAYDLKLKQ